MVQRDNEAATSAAAEGREGFFRRHEWTLVGLLTILTFIGATVGYFIELKPGAPDSPYTWWDAPYLALRLFLIDGPEETAGWPLYMHFARALAPVIVAYTAAKAIWSVVNQKVALYGLLLHKRQYVVVCGVGETGYRIAKDYCMNSDKRVVVIDHDPLNALAAELTN